MCEVKQQKQHQLFCSFALSLSRTHARPHIHTHFIFRTFFSFHILRGRFVFHCLFNLCLKMEMARYRDAKCLPFFLHCVCDEKQSSHSTCVCVCVNGVEVMRVKN